MSDTELLREAARVARSEADPRWHAVADWLDNEIRGAEVLRAATFARHTIAVARALSAKEA